MSLLLSDHITPTELSGLSEQDRVLVRAVKIVQSPEDSSTHSPSASDWKEEHHPPLLGFQCIYCSLSPAVTTVRERSKRLNKVFPSSIETMGASLALLKEKHFSAEASLMDQRCRLLPTNVAQEVFSKATRHNPTKDAYLQRCCEIVAERVGIVNVGSQGSKRGITYRSLSVTASSPKREVAPSTETSEPRSSPEVEGAARSSSSATCQIRDTITTEEEKTNLNLPANASSGTNNTALSSYARIRRQSSRSSSPERRDDLHDTNALPYLPPSSIVPLVPSPKSLSFITYGAGFCCPYCVHIPFHLRAAYSYQAEMPTRERALQHFRKCHFFVMPK
jgi:hypothetical protein